MTLAPGPLNNPVHIPTVSFHTIPQLFPLPWIPPTVLPTLTVHRQVRTPISPPLTLQGDGLEHVHPPPAFILCQCSGRGLVRNRSAFSSGPSPLLALPRGGGLGCGAGDEPSGMKRRVMGEGHREKLGRKRTNIVLFKWMGNDSVGFAGNYTVQG